MILIKGMEMPKNCFDCPACSKGPMDWHCSLLEEVVYWGVERKPNCPLIEIPPHGDLVDRNELLAEYDRQHKGPAGGARWIMEQAKAVIAEGE